jgi:hypothetical protein
MRIRLLPITSSLVAAAATAAIATAGHSPAGHHHGPDLRHDARPYSIGLWGDLPYNDTQKTVGVPALISDINHQPLAFTVTTAT